MIKAGLRYKQVGSVWGKLKLPKQNYHCRDCFYYERDFVEQGMDTSGVLPEALRRAIKLVTKLDFAEATELLNDWGLPVSKSSLERICQSYGEKAWEQAQSACQQRAEQSLPKQTASTRPRRFVIETDGCFVLERAKADSGGLEGREVKSLIIYPLNQPTRRVSLSSPVAIAECRLLAQGLLRQAGVCQGDICLGVGDGAPWVRDLLYSLGCVDNVLDVFHAVSYLDKVLLEIGYSDEERLEERKAWLKGEVDGALWLQTTQAHYNLSDDLLKSWTDEALEAWTYLQKHARQGALAYPHFKAQGWVIGSGQIEGYNKWAILERMRASGMNWSKHGLRRMAFLRSDFASAKPLTHFHEVRLAAFP